MAKRWRGSCCSADAVSLPEGCLPVYVGPSQETRRRYIVPTSHLTHPLFRSLLNIAEAEFGFQHQGGLTIPCHHHHFERILSLLSNASKQKTETKAINLHPWLPTPPPPRLCSIGIERRHKEGSSLKVPLLLLHATEGLGSSV